MTHKAIKVKNEQVFKSQQAAQFVQTASRFESLITIERSNKKVNAKSIMGVLSLNIQTGQTIHLVANGSDEKEATEVLVGLIEGDA